jgi:dTDP-4-dehydrorhamnose 3,5-epimerase
MIIEETHLKDCLVISPNVFNDKRGLFLESFNQKLFEEKTRIKTNFVQDNQSISKKGVVRGLHFQTGAYAQAKLIRVVKGKVLDICVDLREDSATFGNYFSMV